MKYKIYNFLTSSLHENLIKEITDLYNFTFKLKVKSTNLMNKYRGNFFKNSFHSVIFDSNNKLLGIYTFSPRLFSLNGQTLHGIQSLDTCFPYQGIVSPYTIKKMVRDLIEFIKLKIKTIDLIYGFPNKKYENLSKFILGWKYFSTIYTNLHLLPILSLLNKTYEGNSDLFLSNPTSSDQRSRLNSKFFSFLSFKNNNIFLWITMKPFPLQIISVENKSYTEIKCNFRRKLNYLRLLIPSLVSSKKNNFEIFGLSLFPKFNLYILFVNNDIDIKKELIHPNFLWNDVP